MGYHPFEVATLRHRVVEKHRFPVCFVISLRCPDQMEPHAGKRPPGGGPDAGRGSREHCYGGKSYGTGFPVTLCRRASRASASRASSPILRTRIPQILDHDLYPSKSGSGTGECWGEAHGAKCGRSTKAGTSATIPLFECCQLVA